MLPVEPLDNIPAVCIPAMIGPAFRGLFANQFFVGVGMFKVTVGNPDGNLHGALAPSLLSQTIIVFGTRRERPVRHSLPYVCSQCGERLDFYWINYSDHSSPALVTVGVRKSHVSSYV